MQRFFKAAPYLLFLVPGLIFFILNVRIPEERDYLYWEMAFIFHLPLMLFFSVAILMEIVDWYEKKNRGIFGKK